MKKYLIFITIMLSVFSFNIFAQSGGRSGSGRSAMPTDYMMMFDYAGIKLNDNQKLTMGNCISMHESGTRTIFNEIRLLNNSIRDELLKEKPDRKLIKSYIDKKKEKEALIEYMSIDRDITILETLTKEQRVMFYNYQDRMRGGRMRHGGGHDSDKY